MNIVKKFVLKDAGGAAVAVARVIAKGGKSRVEVGGTSDRDVIVCADGQAKLVESASRETGGEVEGIVLVKRGEVVACAGRKFDFAPALAKQDGATSDAPAPVQVEAVAADVPHAADVSQSDPQAASVADAAKQSLQDGSAQELPQDGESERHGEFFELIKPKLDELFDGRERVERLESLFPDSRWVRVDDGDDGAYVVGIVGDPAKFICYGVPDQDGSAPPDGEADSRAWLPLPEGGGYWMMYQSAEDGRTLSAI